MDRRIRQYGNPLGGEFFQLQESKQRGGKESSFPTFKYPTVTRRASLCWLTSRVIGLFKTELKRSRKEKGKIKHPSTWGGGVDSGRLSTLRIRRSAVEESYYLTKRTPGKQGTYK